MRFVLACILRAAGAAPMDGTLISFPSAAAPQVLAAPQVQAARRCARRLLRMAAGCCAFCWLVGWLPTSQAAVLGISSLLCGGRQVQYIGQQDDSGAPRRALQSFRLGRVRCSIGRLVGVDARRVLHQLALAGSTVDPPCSALAWARP